MKARALLDRPRGRRVPGSKAGDYLQYAPLLWADKKKRIGDVVKDRGPLWQRLMHPFLLAALNTEPEESSAALAGAVLRETLAKGGRHYRPRIAQPTLAAAFVDPALAYLKGKGARLQLGARLRGLTLGRRNALAMDLGEAAIPLTQYDAVVLAVPPWVAKDLIPTLTAPDEFRAIVNAHFKTAAPAGAPAMLGVIGGTAEWIFTFHDRISVTVSGADAIVDQDREGWPPASGPMSPRRWISPRPCPLADRQGKARHLRRHPGPGRPPAAGQDRLAQPVPGRRLDPDGAARHHRRGAAVRRNCGGFGAAPSVLIVARMNQLSPGDFVEVEGAIRAATSAILAQQKPDGHWVYELEADATIPAEYVLLVHYLAETPNLELERKIGVYLRRIQGAHGGWPLYHDGAFDISATVKAYFALKMIGDDINAPHMVRAREALHTRGGAIKANVLPASCSASMANVRGTMCPPCRRS